MDQHPIPRQITTFEFKLIGFMTLRQFLYLVVFIPAGIVMYLIFPIPILNILLALMVGGLGVALAFLPINERPLDVWIKNLYRRLTSATQYTYHKQNEPLYFLQDLFFVSDPHRVMAHVESRQKLSAYLNARKSASGRTADKKRVQQLLRKPNGTTTSVSSQPAPSAQSSSPPVGQSPLGGFSKRPFFTGIVKNNRKIPLPGILVYVKDGTGATVRLLKTNPHGVFATYTPLVADEYTFEVKDPRGGYFFDTMKLSMQPENPAPIEIGSKEML